ATFKHTGGVSKFGEKLITGMMANGYERDFAMRTFRQLEGFGSYGFPESHAASFALIAYASSWMKCWHPDVFCAALLNAQPMGFYAPAQIVRDARAHDVEVRPLCINASRWDCTLEPAHPPGPATGHPPLKGEGRIAEGDPGWGAPLPGPPPQAGEGRERAEAPLPGPPPQAGEGRERAEALSPPPGPLMRADLPPAEPRY